MYGVFLLLFALCKAPTFLRRRNAPTLRERLGIDLPSRASIWIHAVSVGEVKASRLLIERLRSRFPDYRVLITTATRTGQREAERFLLDKGAVRILPLDFRLIMRRWVQAIRPEIFILMESDFWPNLLQLLTEEKIPAILMNGKLSERSARRFSWIAPLARKMFSRFDKLCLQDEVQRRRFFPLIRDPHSLLITGNLKLDLFPEHVDLEFWRTHLGLTVNQPVVTIASTHLSEESRIIEALQPLFVIFPEMVCFIAPRHPERFDQVYQELAEFMPVAVWSRGERGSLVLVDAMGLLPICYSLSQVAIVGGSFVEQVGGHNIFEPCLYGAFSLFGPHLFSQKPLLEKVLNSAGGKEVPLSKLAAEVECQLRERGKRAVIVPSIEATEKSFSVLLEVLGKKYTDRL